MRRILDDRLLPAALLGLVLIGAAAEARAWDELLVVTTDYTAYGSVAVVDRQAPWSAALDVEPVGSDAVARWHDGLFYVVDRGGDNLQVLDPAQGYGTVRQFSLGAGRNPQDVAFGPDGAAWVSCYDEAVLLKVDPVTGAVLQTVSTAAFADADGLPETSWMQAVGDRLYVTAQRLDRDNWYTPVGQSHLLVLDMAAGAWVDAAPGTPEVDPVLLAGVNPFGPPEVAAGGAALRVGTAGGFGTPGGGIEMVDLSTLTSGGLVVSGADLGGNLLDFTVTAPDRAYALISDAAFTTSLLRFAPDGGGEVVVVAAAAGYDYADIVHDGAGLLFLADQAAGASGVRVFDEPTGAELTTAPIAVGRKPFLIVPPTDVATTATPPSVPAALAMAAPWPNPANPSLTVSYAGRPGAEVGVSIVDLRGRVLRSWRRTLGPDGRGSVVFTGEDDSARPLPAGVYRAVVRGDGARASRGFSLVR